jgi:prepilin-type N-terminal cleavage/methylation domain-containing protein
MLTLRRTLRRILRCTRWRTQRGYTLVELLVTLAISGVIFSVVASVIYQLSTVSGDGNDRLTANHELQNVGYWFNLDGQSAQEAAAGASLELSLPGDRTVVYSLSGNALSRTEGSNSQTLASNISSATFDVRGGLVSLDITSSPVGRGNISETRNYQVCLRSLVQ